MENNQPSSAAKSAKGYKIVVILMAVILVLISLLYFRQVSQIRADFAIERDTLTNRVTALMTDFDELQTENQAITCQMETEKNRADSLLQRLSKERSLNLSKIRQYEKELGTLRTVMRGFVAQIDSLNTLNSQLIEENITFRKEASTEKLRADMAEEKVDELSSQVSKGSVLMARNIVLKALNKNDKEISRASKAVRLRVDFVLAANKLAKPGDCTVYARITGPDGYIMANNAADVFDFNGEKLTFSAARDIDYQNQDLPVGLYYSGTGIVGGKYLVEIYVGGNMVGSSEIMMK